MSPDDKRPIVYAYWGMGVDHQSKQVAGMVVRISKFSGIGALLATLNSAGSRPFSILNKNVLNQATNEPDRVAEQFRGTMERFEIKCSAEAGNQHWTDDFRLSEEADAALG